MFNWLTSMFRDETSGVTNPAKWLVDWIGGRDTSSGVSVTTNSALNYSSFFQGVNLISGDVSRIPLVLYRREDGGKEKATEHPAYYLMRRKPSADLTVNHLLRTLTAHAIIHGNGYAYIFRNSSFVPQELLLLDPSITFPVRENGRLWYVTQVSGELRRLSPANVLHIRGLGSDGLVGYGVVDRARESLGLGLAAERFGSSFFGNGATSSGLLEYPGKLTDTTVGRIRSQWNSMHQGLQKAHRVAVLEAGIKFHQLSVPPEQAQFLETRRFQRQEIASWLNLPPHKLGDESRTSYNSIESENLDYLNRLDHWLDAFESECWDKLLTESEKRSDDLFFEFHRVSLLKVDADQRSKLYHSYLQDGVMSPNEVRAAENMNPREGGNKYYLPLNMARVDEEGNIEVAPKAESNSAPSNSAPVLDAHHKLMLDLAVRNLLVNAVAKMMRWECDHINRCCKKPNFLAAIDEFYKKHQQNLATTLEPVLECLVAMGVDCAAADVLAADFCEESRELLLDVAGRASAESLQDLVSQEVQGWGARVEQLADSVVKTKAELITAG